MVMIVEIQEKESFGFKKNFENIFFLKKMKEISDETRWQVQTNDTIFCCINEEPGEI